MVTFNTTVDARYNQVLLPNGVRLRVLEQGPRKGPAILMLHGYTDSSYSFTRVLPLFPPGVRVVVPDQRGHGESDRPEAGYDIGDFAGDAIRLMDVLEIPRAVVLGHSMGTFVARQVTAMIPDRVTRLVLVGGASTADNVVVRDLLKSVGELTDPVDPQFARDFQMSCIAQPVNDAFMDVIIASSQKLPARLWQGILKSLIEYKPPVHPPQCRVLVMGGRQDSVFSEGEQIALARSIPNGELELVHGIGHSFQWEDPDRFVRALKRFGAF